MALVGRDLKAHPVPSPCSGQGHLPLDQAAQGPIQSGLEHIQGQSILSLSGQPVPVCLTILSVESFPLTSNQNLPLFSLKPLSFVP